MTTQDINVTIGSANEITVAISGGFSAWTATSTNYAGSAFSGTAGTTGRSLVHTSPVKIVVVDNMFLQPTYDYSLTNGSKITLSTKLWEDQKVTIWN